jgi:hypothetical protein
MAPAESASQYSDPLASKIKEACFYPAFLKVLPRNLAVLLKNIE